MKVSNNTLGAWALLPESVTLLAHPPTLFCSRGFLIANWLGVPSSKKFCKIFGTQSLGSAVTLTPPAGSKATDTFHGRQHTSQSST